LKRRNRRAAVQRRASVAGPAGRRRRKSDCAPGKQPGFFKASAESQESKKDDPQTVLLPFPRNRARLFLGGLLPSSARLRFTGQNQTKIAVNRKQEKTPYSGVILV
jgi:hypothetical protein